MTQALEGVRVLDLCRGYPPAFAAMFLADFGADVIKIDPTGFIFPHPVKTTEEKWSAYYHLDRNKRSIKINLRSDRGREVLYKLAKEADVLIENSRPGTMERLGIGYDTLKKTNPRIIFCAVSGYGQDGPYRDLVGHDANYLGVAGALSLIGPKDGPPSMPSNIIADMAGAGLHPLIGILIALVAREKTGRGQFIDISYTDCVFSLLGFDVALYLCSGELRRRGKTVPTGGEPCSAIYQTKDGEYLAIQFIELQFWANFCEQIGRPDLVPLQWPQNDNERQRMFAFLRELFLAKTRDEWWEWAKDKQVMFGPVRYLEEALVDPQLRHRQMVVEIDHPTLGKITQVGNPLKLSETPHTFRRFGPFPGQHTDEILEGLNYSKQQIEEIRKEGAIE
jgi:crotonobetainyl-CoA:carnitine CoA-transferase CaiB-like acyl-CoA transferase